MALSNLGLVLDQQGRVEEAIVNYQKALKIDANDAMVHANLGRALIRQGRVEKAIVHCQKALEIEPRLAMAHTNLANGLIRQGRTEDAITHYRKALEIDPGDASAHDNLGKALFQTGEVEEAINHYRRALEIDANYDPAHDHLGQALFRQGKIDSAITHCQKAIEIRKAALGEMHLDYAASLNNLAFIYLSTGEYRLAEPLCRQAVGILKEVLPEKHPDYISGLYNMAQIYHSTSDHARAESVSRQILEVSPSDSRAHYLLGITLHQQGRDLKAIDHLRDALRLQPNQVTILLRSAWVLATSPDASVRNGIEAVALAERAVQLSGSPTPILLDALAAAYAEAGRFSEATQTAQGALEMAASQTNTVLADALRDRIKLYQAGSAFRDSEQAATPSHGHPR